MILGDPLYNQALNQAYVESHVFRYADKVTLYFQCAISMCMKSEGSCVGITVRSILALGITSFNPAEFSPPTAAPGPGPVL